jgi:hypothetical protein
MERVSSMWREVLLILFYGLSRLFSISPFPYLSFPLFHQRIRLVKVEKRGSHKSAA